MNENEKKRLAAEAEINLLEAQLRATDYKIIKQYEEALGGTATGYDKETIIAERQKKRDRVNELQEELKGLEGS